MNSLKAALDRKESSLNEIFSFAINPFSKLSTLPTLSFGSLFVLLMSLLGTKASIYFPGAIDLQIVRVEKYSFSALELIVQNAINILCLAGAFYLGSLLLRQRNLRPIDFLSSVALARLPYAAFVLIISALAFLFPAHFPRPAENASAVYTIVIALLAITVLAWHLGLLFTAARESSGLKGKGLWIVYIGGLLAAEAASYGLNALLIN